MVKPGRYTIIIINIYILFKYQYLFRVNKKLTNIFANI